jgi:hypothetical protein
MTKCAMAVAITVMGLVGCGKAVEKVAEKAVESRMETSGGQAKVDLSGGGIKMTTTDASGKTTQLEMGTARVSESDIGLSFYPGTRPRDGEASRISSPEGTTYTVMLHSEDAPDKVAGFYREKLKAQAEGRQYMESSGGDSHTLMLSDEKTKHITQVVIAKAENQGSDIQIVANRSAAK